METVQQEPLSGPGSGNTMGGGPGGVSLGQRRGLGPGQRPALHLLPQPVSLCLQVARQGGPRRRRLGVGWIKLFSQLLSGASCLDTEVEFRY